MSKLTKADLETCERENKTPRNYGCSECGTTAHASRDDLETQGWDARTRTGEHPVLCALCCAKAQPVGQRWNHLFGCALCALEAPRFFPTDTDVRYHLHALNEAFSEPLSDGEVERAFESAQVHVKRRRKLLVDLEAASSKPPPKPTDPRQYEALGQELGRLVAKKNAAYGDSFNVSGQFLPLLWPNGIPRGREGDALVLVRMFDKMMRIATDEGAFDEAPWDDLVGYALLKAEERRRLKAGFDLSGQAMPAPGHPAYHDKVFADMRAAGANAPPPDAEELTATGYRSAADDPLTTHQRWVESELATFRQILPRWVEPTVVVGPVVDDDYDPHQYASTVVWVAGEVRLECQLQGGVGDEALLWGTTWTSVSVRNSARYTFGGPNARDKAWEWFLRAYDHEQGAQDEQTATPPPQPEGFFGHMTCRGPAPIAHDCWGRRKYPLVAHPHNPLANQELAKVIEAEGWSPLGELPGGGRACPPCWKIMQERRAQDAAAAQVKYDRELAELEDLGRYLREYGAGVVKVHEEDPKHLHLRASVLTGGLRSKDPIKTLGFVRVAPGGTITYSYAGTAEGDVSEGAVPQLQAWQERKNWLMQKVAAFYERQGE